MNNTMYGTILLFGMFAIMGGMNLYFIHAESTKTSGMSVEPYLKYPKHSQLDLFLAAPKNTLINFDAIVAIVIDKLLGPVYCAISKKECWDCDIYEEGPAGELGPLQITPIIVHDVNEYLEFPVYTLNDRLDYEASTRMFIYYYKRYTYRPDTVNAELIARRWNGGPTGEQKSATMDIGRRLHVT